MANQRRGRLCHCCVSSATFGGIRGEWKALLTERWHTDELTPTRRAKPAGVMGAGRHRAAHVSKRFRSGDPAPADPSELTVLSLDTRTLHTADYSRGRRQQDRPLHASLGEHVRRERPVERDGECDHRGVRKESEDSLRG